MPDRSRGLMPARVRSSSIIAINSRDERPCGADSHVEPVPLADRHADDGGAGVERKQQRHAAQYTGGRPW